MPERTDDDVVQPMSASERRQHEEIATAPADAEAFAPVDGDQADQAEEGAGE